MPWPPEPAEQLLRPVSHEQRADHASQQQRSQLHRSLLRPKMCAAPLSAAAAPQTFPGEGTQARGVFSLTAQRRETPTPKDPPHVLALRTRVLATVVAALVGVTGVTGCRRGPSRGQEAPHHKHHTTHHKSAIPQHNGGDRDADKQRRPERWRRERPDRPVMAASLLRRHRARRRGLRRRRAAGPRRPRLGQARSGAVDVGRPRRCRTAPRGWPTRVAGTRPRGRTREPSPTSRPPGTAGSDGYPQRHTPRQGGETLADWARFPARAQRGRGRPARDPQRLERRGPVPRRARLPASTTRIGRASPAIASWPGLVAGRHGSTVIVAAAPPGTLGGPSSASSSACSTPTWCDRQAVSK